MVRAMIGARARGARDASEAAGARALPVLALHGIATRDHFGGEFLCRRYGMLRGEVHVAVLLLAVLTCPSHFRT